jgi:exopolysaccharide biosynthesis polyprenyl glycosylphosphotransferase
MLKHYSRLTTIIVVAADIMLLQLCFFLTYLLYYKRINGVDSPERLLFCYSFITFYFICARRRGLLKILNFLEIPAIRKKTLSACLTAGFFSASFVYFVKISHFSRIFFTCFVLSSSVVLIIQNVFFKFLLKKSRERGYSFSNVLLICPEPREDDIFKTIKSKQEWGMRVIGEFHYLYATENELRTFLLNEAIDQVYVELSDDRSLSEKENLKNLIRICESMGKTIRFFIGHDFINQAELTDYEKLYGLHTFVKEPITINPGFIFWKRLMDIAGGLTGIIITLIIIPPIWLLMQIFDRGPLFYSQSRVGWNGRTFKIFKFRTMIVNAEKMQMELEKDNEMNGALFKIRNDPRVTGVGKFLRRFSIDEFPQFFNVLKGDMSLVGTRPPTPDEVRKYQDWHLQRIMLKPGLTGLWQTSGRSEIQDFDTIVKLDLKYIKNWSLWSDIRIIIKTVTQLFYGKGAY